MFVEGGTNPDEIFPPHRWLIMVTSHHLTNISGIMILGPTFMPHLICLPWAPPLNIMDMINYILAIDKECQSLIRVTTSFFLPNHNLHLYNILHVPKLTKNLLSVQRFTIDNSCFFEFWPNHFTIKDKVTKKVLLQGSSKDDCMNFEINMSHDSRMSFLSRLACSIGSSPTTNYFKNS